MKNKLLFLFIVSCQLLLVNCVAQAKQQTRLDSLLAELSTHEKDDSVKVNTLIRIGYQYRLLQSDSSIYFLREALALSKKINFLKGEVSTYKYLGGNFPYTFDSAYYYFRLAVNAAKQAKDSFALGHAYYDVAYTLLNGTNMSSRENEKTVNKDAALYIDSSVTIFQAIGDTEQLINSLTRQAEIFMYMNRMPEAGRILNKAMAIYKLSSVKGLQVSGLYITKGEYHFRNSEFDSALACHKKSLAILEEERSNPGVAYALGWIAHDYSKLGKYNLAIESAEKGLKIAEENKLMKEKLDAITALYEVYKEKKDYATALKYYEQLFQETDSLNASLARESTSKFNLQLEAQKNKEKITVLLKDQQIQEQKVTRQRIILFALIVGLTLIIALAYSIFRGKKRSDELLLNILPSEVAEELKAKGSADAKQFDDVTVLFTDFKGFTQLSEKLTPAELISEINECFSAFDHIMQKYGVEKIKTIGDAYMAAGGIPTSNTTHAEDVVKAALDIQQFMLEHKLKRQSESKLFFEIRIGVHTGAVVAGIVGVKKFAYDIWGDTVNTASRMESSGEAGKVNISGSTYELVKNKFKCVHRGKIQAKNKGEIDMYFVERIS